MIAAKPEAIELFHRGMLALSQVESNGVLIDEVYLEGQLEKTEADIKRAEAELKSHKIFQMWRKRFGEKTKLGSKPQLETVIFDILGHKRTGRITDSGEYSSDYGAFEFVDEPFVRQYFRLEKKKKLHGTYLSQTKRELMNGKLHAFFNLHTVLSFRSSADRPSLQNYPIRDWEQGQIIRRCFIAPKGYRIGEIDYKGIEVCISPCYNKDPKLINYVEDPATDMHRDMAIECYKLKAPQITKETRYNAKNKFVFPQFYGSWYIPCAKALWEAIELMDLKTKKGTPLKKHLAQQGIKSLGPCDPDKTPSSGTFEYHIQQVEKRFWDERFKVYKQWKWDFWNKYLDRGWFRLKTGFVCKGLHNRRQVCNYPIQGSAFHCLLWSMIRLMDWMQENKLKSKVVAEIHDSLLIYFHHKEIDDVIYRAKEIMTEEIREHWKWIIVPLSIEVELAPKGGSWAHKQPYELK